MLRSQTFMPLTPHLPCGIRTDFFNWFRGIFVRIFVFFDFFHPHFSISSATGGPLTTSNIPQRRNYFNRITQFPNCLHRNLCVKMCSKVVKRRAFLYKKWSKVVKSRAFFGFFGRFSTVQQCPECVFAPINTDSPPGSAEKSHQIPVFHITDSQRPFIILCLAGLYHTFTFWFLHFSHSSAKWNPQAFPKNKTNFKPQKTLAQNTNIRYFLK